MVRYFDDKGILLTQSSPSLGSEQWNQDFSKSIQSPSAALETPFSCRLGACDAGGTLEAMPSVQPGFPQNTGTRF